MKRRFTRVTLLVCWLISIQQTYAQTIITGKIMDTVTGDPLIGATIKVIGENESTITNSEGIYSIRALSQKGTLQISYIGYYKQQINIAGRKVINVKLERTDSSLDEVIVIGYGQVSRRDLTGSVGSVNMKDFEKAPVRSFDEALAGRVAGVQVSSNDGQPGASNNIIIRGGNSLTQDNSPLYVIDGIPIESPEMNSISPYDIESMEILKDASATAIYGARGANGVILITTKMINANKKVAPQIQYNGSYGFQNNPQFIDLLSPYEFVRYQLELNEDKTNLMYLAERTLDDYKEISGLNMQDELYRTAPMQNHNFSITGANEGTSYTFSTNLINQDGVIVNSGFNRIQGRLAINQKLTDKIKFYVNANYNRNTSYGSVTSASTGGIASIALIYNALGYRPVAGNDDVDLGSELFDPDIDPASADYRVNPVISAKNEINRRINDNLALSSYLQYDINKKLSLRISGGTTLNKLNTEIFHNSKTQQGNPRGFPTSLGINGSLYEYTTNDWVNENILTFKEKIEDHNFTILGGVSFQGNKKERFGYQASFLSNDYLGLDGLDESTSITPLRTSGNWTLMSYLTRVNYDFKSKYFFTGTFRADGSSKFPSNRWGYFPSLAVAWQMKKEGFLKDAGLISDSKLRISYGLTGNNRVGDFDYYPTLDFEYFSFYSFNNQNPSRGVNLTSIGNPNLRWETTRQWNFGYDLGLFGQRIELTVDAYEKVTSDLLLRAQLPYTTGYLSAVRNIGEVSNRGLEFTLNTKNIIRNNFSWTSNFNISFNQNKVLALTDGQDELFSTVSFVGDFTSLNLYRAKVGESIGMIYGTVFDGLYQYDDFYIQDNQTYILKPEVSTNGSPRASIKPGDVKLKDLSGDGTVTADDFTVIGRGLPIHTGGFSNSFTFKRFDLNVFFQWSYGNDIVNGNRIYFEQNPYNYPNFNQYATVMDRWSPDNQSNRVPRTGSLKPKYYNSDIVEDGSFLRLKTVSLGYNLGDKSLKLLRIKGLRMYCSTQNLYTWTNYSGSDPEVSVKHSPLTPGFDFSAYPRARTIVFGLNVSF